MFATRIWTSPPTRARPCDGADAPTAWPIWRSSWLGSIRPEGFHVVIESTTNSRAIARMWQEYGRQAGVAVQADVVNARKVRIIAESVCKTDRLDAQVLSELARSNLRLPVCYVPDDEVFALREHLRARADLVRIRTMLKNRVHAVLHRRGILTPEQDLFGKAGQEWFHQVELDEAGRQIVSRFPRGLDDHRADDRGIDGDAAGVGPAGTLEQAGRLAADDPRRRTDHEFDDAGGVGGSEPLCQPGGGDELCRADPRDPFEQRPWVPGSDYPSRVAAPAGGAGGGGVGGDPAGTAVSGVVRTHQAEKACVHRDRGGGPADPGGWVHDLAQRRVVPV